MFPPEGARLVALCARRKSELTRGQL